MSESNNVIEIPSAEFQQKVLAGVDALTTKVADHGNRIERVLSDYTRLDKETKKGFEELTKLQKTANDQAANFVALQRKLTEVIALVQRQAAGAFGDPIARVVADEEMRARLNAAVRLGVARSDQDIYARHAREILTKAGLGEDASPGSLLIDDRLAGQIYDLIADYGIWNTVEVVPVSTKDNKFPVDTADPVAQFVLTEGNAIDDDANIAGTSYTATAEVVAVLLNVSLQLLEDAEYDLTSWIMKKFARAYAKRLDHATFTADGTADATDGGMTGVFHAGTAATTAAGNTTVQGTDLEDWQRCLVTAAEAVLGRAARWWMHPHILSYAMLVRDENGRPIFQNALEAPNARAIGQILGYPITLGFALPSTNSAGQKVAAFGDPAGQVNGVRRAYSFDASDHHKWNTLQRSFRGWGRFATKNRGATAFSILTTAAA